MQQTPSPTATRAQMWVSVSISSQAIHYPKETNWQDGELRGGILNSLM